MGDFLFFFQISKFRFSPAYLALLTAEWRNIRLKSSGVIVSNREASRARNSSLGANSWCTEGRADLFHGQHCWQVSHPYTRSPILSATKGAISVGQLSIQREQSPHRATTGLSGGRSKEVINSPKKKKEPLPGIINWAFFPIKPRPARTAQ